MQPLPELETCLRLAWDARDDGHPSGVALASYFARAAVRGRRRAELDPELLFPKALGIPERAIEQALDGSTWRACPEPRPTVPDATREWLAEAALSLGRAEGFPLMWALLRAMSELEAVSHKLVGARATRAHVRRVLHGVEPRALRVEPFAALLVRVLKIAQAVYAAHRHAGSPHEAAWAGVQDRLWSAHPTGRQSAGGGEARGAYLPSLVQAASGNARRKMKRSAEEGRTREHARALLARFAAGPGRELWPWTDAAGRLLPEATLLPDVAGLCFFVLLTHAASERRTRGGPSGGLSQPFDEAGFSASEWLPDRTDDLAVRLLAAPEEPPRAELLDSMSALLRGTLRGNGAFDVPRAREKLPALLRWLEENGRELLETT